MNQLFDNNLRLLEAYDPITADRIRNHQPQGRAQLISTSSPQNPSLRVNDAGLSYLIHSSREPMREAQRWAENVALQSPYNILIFGCGLMYHAYQLALKVQQTLNHLIIVDKEPDVIHTVFNAIDLTAFLRTKSTFFLTHPTPFELRAIINKLLTSITLDGLSVVDHHASVEIHKQYYADLKKVVDESLQSAEILLRTKVQLGGLIQENIIRNVPQLLSNPTASGLVSILSNIPAFVVGAGPSLDRNVQQLRQIEDKGVIIAVDTVFKNYATLALIHTLLSHLIQHGSTQSISRELMIWAALYLAFSPSVYHEILPGLLEPVSLPLPASRFLRTLNQVLGDQTYFKTGTNVGQTSFNLARLLRL